MKCNFEKFSNLHKCNFTFSLQMMMIWGSHNTKQTFFLRIPNTFANHYPSSFFSFYLKEHYYTVHGIGEAKEKMGQNLWGEEAVTKALKIHNLLDDFSCCYFLREKTKVEERRRDTHRITVDRATTKMLKN